MSIKQKYPLMLVELKELEAFFRVETCENFLFKYQIIIPPEVITLTNEGKTALIVLQMEEIKMLSLLDSPEVWDEEFISLVEEQVGTGPLVVFLTTELIARIECLLELHPILRERYVLFSTDARIDDTFEEYYLGVPESMVSKEEYRNKYKIKFVKSPTLESIPIEASDTPYYQ